MPCGRYCMCANPATACCSMAQFRMGQVYSANRRSACRRPSTIRWPPMAFCSKVTPRGSKCHSASQCRMRSAVERGSSPPFTRGRSRTASRTSALPMSASTEMMERLLTFMAFRRYCGDTGSPPATPQSQCTWASPANQPAGSGFRDWPHPGARSRKKSPIAISGCISMKEHFNPERGFRLALSPAPTRL
jgi:hypothetical protein